MLGRLDHYNFKNQDKSFYYYILFAPSRKHQ